MIDEKLSPPSPTRLHSIPRRCWSQASRRAGNWGESILSRCAKEMRAFEKVYTLSDSYDDPRNAPGLGTLDSNSDPSLAPMRGLCEYVQLTIEASPDAPEYRKALAAFEPSTRRIVPIFARWKCAERCCPDREPQEHALQPT